MNLDFLRSLPGIRWAIEIGRLAAFITFISLGLRLLWLERRGLATRRATVMLVAWSLFVTSAVGFTQIEAWPFTNWALVENVSHIRMQDWILYGLDETGRSYRLDYRFVHPLPYEDFDTWMKTFMLRTGNGGERRIAQFLVDRAEAARVRFLATGRVSTNERYLRAAAAPYHFVRPRQWRTSADVPSTKFTGLQIWREEWSIEERHGDESRVSRDLIFEYRP